MPNDRIVADGRERLTKAVRAEVTAEVQARYAEQLAGAGILRRLLLHLRMQREIAEEVARRVPPDALYLRN